MTALSILKDYLENLIKTTEQDLADNNIEQLEQRKAKFEKVLKLLNKGTSEELLENDQLLTEVLELLFSEESKENIAKMKESIHLHCELTELLSKRPEIITYQGPQKRLLRIVNRNFEDLITKLKVKIEELNNLKPVYQQNHEKKSRDLKRYKDYLCLFDEHGINIPLHHKELEQFIGFLSEIDLDQQTVYELICLFLDYNIKYARQQSEIKQEQEETSKLQFEKHLNYVNHIVESLKSRFGFKLPEPNSKLSQIFEGKNSIEDRKRIYESIEDEQTRWQLIMYDITENLIPNFKNNQEQILPIFDYIISEFKKIQYKQDLKDSHLPQETEEKILKSTEEIIQNNEMSSETLKSIILYIQNEDMESAILVATGAGLEQYQAILFVKAIELKEKYETFQRDRRAFLELRDEQDYDINVKTEFHKECLKEIIAQKEHLLLLLEELEEINEIIKGTGKVEPLPIIQMKSLQESENIFVMLDGVLKADEELVLEKQKESLPNVINGIKLFQDIPYINITSYKNKIILDVKPSDGIPDHTKKGDRDHIEPKRLRRNEARILFIELGTSKAVKEYLLNKYENKNKSAHIILIMGFDLRINDSPDTYKDFNRRIHEKFKEITRIRKLFSNPNPTLEELEEISLIVEKSYAQYTELCTRYSQTQEQTVAKNEEIGRGGKK